MRSVYVDVPCIKLAESSKFEILVKNLEIFFKKQGGGTFYRILTFIPFLSHNFFKNRLIARSSEENCLKPKILV